MKKLLAAVLLALPFTVQAEDTSMQWCKPVHKLSETIMESRQKGVSMVDILEMAETVESENLKNLAISIVEEAYDSTRYHTRENQLRAIQDFGNDMFMICMKASKGNEK